MINNTFYIVFREPNPNNIIPNPSQDQWGWELADNIEITEYKDAQKMREEYQKAMPKMAVRIRAIPIQKAA
jgi:hypothetical protein